MDLKDWKDAVARRLSDSADFLNKMAPGTLYGTLAASSLSPVIVAANGGDFAAIAALTGVVGGVGGNLVANQIQAWKDRSDEVLAAELGELAATDPAWQDALDAILTELETPRIVQNILAEADRDWFVRTLRDELTALGNLDRYEQFFTSYTATNTGTGAIAQGPGAVAAGAGGVAVGGDVNGPITINNHPVDPTAPDPASLRKAYLSRLFTQLQALSLGGVDPKVASDAQVRLRLNAVYTALLTEQVEGEGRMGSGGPERMGRSRRISAVEQIDRHKRLVLLGDPGSGKSTFVNFVALCLAGESLGEIEANLALLTEPLPDQAKKEDGEEKEPDPQPWAHGPLLPVRVVLRDFAARGLPAVGEAATAGHLWDFMEAELTNGMNEYAPFLRNHLRERGGLVLLDGLDEVPAADQRRAQIKEAVEDFAAAFPACRIVVTSRTYAYQRQDWQLSGFAEAVLAPFSPGQIDRFVDRWYAHIGPLRHWSAQDSQGRAAILKRAIAGSDRLGELAERPLLLTLMATLHAWRGGSLPERREELYNDAVDLLLDWWETQRVGRDDQGQSVQLQPSLAEWLKVDRAKVRTLLNRLAYEAHADQAELVGTADLAESALITGLLGLSKNPDAKPRRLVEYLSNRAGLLVPRGNGVYTFPHRTFQEYLAACHLTDTDFPDTVAELARTDPNRWREVALLAGAKAAGGTASAIWSLADALCHRDHDDSACTVADRWGGHLAGQALVESADLTHVSERNQAKLDRVRHTLVHVLGSGDLPAVERALAGRTLAHLGDPRPEVMTVEGMHFCYVPAGPFTMGSPDDSETPDAWGKETPQHTVDIPYDFWMGRYPVTNAQFQAFVQAGGYDTEDYWDEAQSHNRWKNGTVRVWNYDYRSERIDGERWQREPYDFDVPFHLSNHPVVGISWYEAVAFTRWLTSILHTQALIPEQWIATLPSEAEWEKSARGGLQIPNRPSVGSFFTLPEVNLKPNPRPDRRFPWGDESMPEQVNCAATDINGTNASGCFLFSSSPYGVEELSGGVYEWTRSIWWDKSGDRFFNYPYIDSDGREESTSSDQALRVIRGASWSNDFHRSRVSGRNVFNPDGWFDNRGFRLVLIPVCTSSDKRLK